MVLDTEEDRRLLLALIERSIIPGAILESVVALKRAIETATVAPLPEDAA